MVGTGGRLLVDSPCSVVLAQPEECSDLNGVFMETAVGSVWLKLLVLRTLFQCCSLKVQSWSALP